MMIERVEVVIPARGEETSIGAALRAVDMAANGVAVPTRIHVVLDDCGDRSLEVIRCTAIALHVEVIARRSTSVGEARALGVEVATAGCSPTATWIACTDADSTVPPAWLATHVAMADAGIGAVVGSVTVADWSARPRSLRDVFRRRYEDSQGPAPIHGANLGVRLDAYRRAGGFAPLSCGEDLALVTALRTVGTTIAYTTAAPVTTSARRTGRARGGFADTLTAWTSDTGSAASSA